HCAGSGDCTVSRLPLSSAPAHAGPHPTGSSHADRELGPPGRDQHDRGAHPRSLSELQAPQTRSARITGQIGGPHLPHQGGRHQIREGECGVIQLRRPEHAHEARLSRSYADAQGPRRAPDRTHGDDAGPDAEDDRIRLGAAVCETGRNVSRPLAARILAHAMGVPDASDEYMQRWSQTLIDGAGTFGWTPGPFDATDIANAEMDKC